MLHLCQRGGRMVAPVSGHKGGGKCSMEHSAQSSLRVSPPSLSAFSGYMYEHAFEAGVQAWRSFWWGQQPVNRGCAAKAEVIRGKEQC